MIVDAGIEQELKDLDAKDKLEMREGLGVHDDGVNDLIRKGYEMLGLITYFTTGEDETRAWTIKRGWTAPEAGTAIHGDFKEKFVRAEIIEWDKLLAVGSEFSVLLQKVAGLIFAAIARTLSISLSGMRALNFPSLPAPPCATTAM